MARMAKKAFLVALVLLLAGCSARVQVNTGAGVVPTSSGSSIVSGPSGVRVQAGSNSFAAAILAISLLAGAIHYSREEPGPFPSPSALLPEATAPAPELAPARRVNEQDCTQPIADATANLKCR
jgi:outer membrane murein-binding lipoprotein Lpp